LKKNQDESWSADDPNQLRQHGCCRNKMDPHFIVIKENIYQLHNKGLLVAAHWNIRGVRLRR
jgi:hypothetical protein